MSFWLHVNVSWQTFGCDKNARGSISAPPSFPSLGRVFARVRRRTNARRQRKRVSDRAVSSKLIHLTSVRFSMVGEGVPIGALSLLAAKVAAKVGSKVLHRRIINNEVENRVKIGEDVGHAAEVSWVAFESVENAGEEHGHFAHEKCRAENKNRASRWFTKTVRERLLNVFTNSSSIVWESFKWKQNLVQHTAASMFDDHFVILCYTQTGTGPGNYTQNTIVNLVISTYFLLTVAIAAAARKAKAKYFKFCCIIFETATFKTIRVRWISLQIWKKIISFEWYWYWCCFGHASFML